MWVVALSALSSAGGLMSFGRGIFQAFMCFCFGLLGLSGMDILNLPVSRRGVRYFFLKCFLSDDPRKWNISVWLRGTEQYVNRFSILTVSAWGVTWGGWSYLSSFRPVFSWKSSIDSAFPLLSQISRSPSLSFLISSSSLYSKIDMAITSFPKRLRWGTRAESQIRLCDIQFVTFCHKLRWEQ